MVVPDAGVAGIMGAGVVGIMALGVVLPGRGVCVMPPGIGVTGSALEPAAPLGLDPAAALAPDGGATLGVCELLMLGEPAQPDMLSASTVQTWQYDHRYMANLHVATAPV